MKINRAAYEALSEEERAEVDAILADVAEAVEDNPLYAFFPHPKQAAFLAARQRKKIVTGGNRSGKTEISIANDIIQCVDRESLPPHLREYKHLDGPVKGRIVVPKFNENHEQVTFPKIRSLVPKGQLQGGSWEKAFSKQRRVLHFENGSTIQFLTFEQDVDAHASADLDFVHFDEEPPGEHGWQIYRENLARLIDRNGFFFLSMTPLFGMSWTYDEFWEKRGEEVAKDTFATDKLFLVQVDMDDNPHLSEEAKQDYLDGLTEEEKQARKKGQFVHFGGLVYGEFDRDTHVVSEPRISHIAEMDTIVSIDPGIRTTGIVFVGFDRDNVAWLYDELYLHNEDAIPENAARLIKGKLDNWEVADPTFIIDPSARNRASVNADNVQAAYFRAGILTLPAQNAVEAGIFEVKRRLQSTPPMLRISERCERWLWERTRYRIKPQEAIEKFEVVKRDDHLMDAFRYAAMARPIAPNFLTPKKARRHAFTPDYQPPYREETPPVETGPLGPMS